MLDPYGECSTPQAFGVGLPGDTGLSFDFRDACDVHDYGYDLLRYFGKRKEPLGKVARRDADDLFFSDMSDHCETRTFLAESKCHTWAAVFYDFVTAASLLQGYGVPSGSIGSRRT